MRPDDRRLLAATRAARAPLATTTALGVGVAVLTIAQAALLAHVVAAAPLGHAGLEELRTPLIALAAVLVLRAAAGGAFEIVGRTGAARVLAELRERLARHVLADRPGAARGERAGELATTAVGGIDALEAYFSRYLPQLVLAAVAPLLVLAWLLPTDPLPALLLAGTLPLVPLFMVLVGRKTADHTRARFATLSLLGAHFLDVVEGLPTLRAHGREGRQARMLAEVGERLRTETLQTLRLAFMSALVLELLAMIGTALAAVTIGIQLVEGAVTLEAGLTVLILAPELYAPLREVGAQYHASADGLQAAARLAAAAEAPPDVRVSARPLPAPDPQREPIVLDAVAYAPPGRRPVLEAVSGSIGPGPGLIAITGESGAGKTTLARLLLRLLDPDAGHVRCGGVDVAAADPRDWRRHFVWIPQRPTLFAATVAENVRLAAPGASDERVKSALHAVHAPALDAGTRIGDGGRVLSAGEAQRIALARAWASDRPVVVLDEPTAHLDGDTAERVGDAIAALARERLVVVLTHDDPLAARADRVLALEHGVLREAVPA